jgi:preprotein translocase subunit SecG
MLYYLVVTIYVLVCLGLIGSILLQQGKGGDIANAFGGGGSQAAFGARAGATLLTRVTSVLAGLFVVLSLALTAWGQRGPGSVVGGIDAPAPPPAAALPAPAPATPAPVTTTPAPDATAPGTTVPAAPPPPAGGAKPPPGVRSEGRRQEAEGRRTNDA